MDSQYKTFGYQITTDPGFQNKRLGNAEELTVQFNDLYIESKNKKNKKIISKLTALILKYPKSPQLKNFLSVAYNVQGNYKKASEVNKWILTEHPDYLFAKINLANEYIEDGHPERVPEVLGEAMEIKGLYPERDLFHLAEVTGYYRVAIRYYVAINNLDLAENRLEVLMEMAPGHPDTEASEMLLMPLRMKENLKRWKEEEEARIKVACIKPVPELRIETAPVFNHPQINNLYTWGIEIPTEDLQEILTLDRETVIADLEKVLQDAADRYLHFNSPDSQEEAYDFALHAICLLGELKSESSLPAILSFLENDEDVLAFWLGDHIHETIWKPLYWLSQNSLGLLKQFLLKPGIYTYSKTVISEVLAEIANHQPQRRDEIITIYKEVFIRFLQADLKDNLIDSDYLGLAIGKAIDGGFIELLPVIKELYDKEYVSLGVNGSYEEVKKYFENPSQGQEKNKIENIFEIYEDILNTWASHSDLRDDLEYNDDEKENIRQPVVSNKIGRNDPCPCGSGKKFKKCCQGKLQL